MSEENSINIRAGRKSSRPSVAAKMSQLASDKGDISYDSVLRIVGEEIDAEKKSKMLLRTSLLLLFSLLAVTAANAGLTFAVVEFAKDTKVDGGVMTAKDSTEAVKVANTDFHMTNGGMVDASEAPVAVASVEEELTSVPETLEELSAIQSISLDGEDGSHKVLKVASFEMSADGAVVFETVDGPKINFDRETGEFSEIAEEGRKLLRYSRYSRYSIRSRSFRRAPARESYYLTRQSDWGRKSAGMSNMSAQMRADSTKSYNQNKNKVNANLLNYDAYDLRVEGDKIVLRSWDNGSLIRPVPRRSLQGSGSYYASRRSFWMYDLPNTVPYDCTSGSVTDGTYTYSCDNVGLHSYTGLSALSMSDSSNDIWGLSLGVRDFVYIGAASSCAFVEVSDPNNPIVLGSISFTGDGSIAYTGSTLFGDSDHSDAKNLGSDVYIVNFRGNSKMYKVDANQFLTHNPGSAITYTTFVPPNYKNAHNIQIHMGVLFTMYNSGPAGWYDCAAYSYGIMIHSTSGANVGCIARTGYHSVGDAHDVAFFNYSGTNIAFFSCGQEYATHGISVFNVNTPASPSWVAYSPFPSGGLYSHSLALTADGSFGVICDEFDEMGMWTSPTTFAPGQTGGNIRLRYGSVSASGVSGITIVQTSISGSDHQGMIADDYFFLAGWNSGFHIFDISGGSINAVRAGYLDISSWTGTGFGGAWGVHVFSYNACNPYNLSNGGNTYYKVAVSGRDGLYLMQPDFHTGSATSCAGVYYTYGSGSGKK